MIERKLASTYSEAVQQLNSITQFAPLTGNVRGEKMLSSLNNPEAGMNIIHVAGTNGKGSTCAFLAGIIEKIGHKTGLFISPHLVDIRERIQINGCLISEEAFLEYFNEVERKRDIELAYFDYLLGIAMLYYKANGVDTVVMETGLGGRLDATNSIKNPVATVITTISLEHTALLGDTVEKIAKEKAGIIKPGVPVIYSGMSNEAAQVIEEIARINNCKSVAVDGNTFSMVQNTPGYIDFSIHNEYYKNDCFRVRTNALYQMENASLALTTIGVLCEQGSLENNKKALYDGLYETIFPGRMELIADNFYVDGAHNPQGIECFVASVNSLYESTNKREKAMLLFSVVSDKDFDKMIATLSGCKHFSKAYVTVTGGSRRLSAEEIKTAFEKYFEQDVEIVVADQVLDVVREWRKEKGLIFATGSLYLVGDVKRAFACVED